MSAFFSRHAGLLQILFLCIALLPWLLVQFNIAVNTNHAWLFIAASRLLDGGTMLSDAYETNPPLSILLYFPSVLLSRGFGIPAEYAPYLFGLIGLGGTAAIFHALLKQADFLDTQTRHILLAAFIIGGTIIPSNFNFAERDAFVAYGLVPFLTAQILITRGLYSGKIALFLALFLCGVMIIIKPHYIIFPALLFLHRLFVWRDFWRVFRSPDLWALGLACIAYALTLVLFFQDYLFQIFPNFLKYYISTSRSDVVNIQSAGHFLTLAAFAIIVIVTAPRSAEKKIALALTGATILAIGLFWIQRKGFSYHLVPAHIFAFMALSTWLATHTKIVLRREKAGVFLALPIMVLFAYTIAPLKTSALSHDDYKILKLPMAVLKCGELCPFFLFSENMDILWQTSIYTGQPHASRFPGLWWEHFMLFNDTPPSERDQFAAMVAEDFNRYRPKMLFIATNLALEDGTHFDFIKTYSQNPSFAEAMRSYKKTGALSDNRGSYFRGTNLAASVTIEYEIYQRID